MVGVCVCVCVCVFVCLCVCVFVCRYNMELLLDAVCTFLKQIVATVGAIVKKQQQPNIIHGNSRVKARDIGQCDLCGGYGPLGYYCEDCEDTNMMYDQ